MTFWIFLSTMIAVFIGSSLAGLLAFFFVGKNFFRPRIYIKNVQVLPVKGDIEGNRFLWGGLVFTGDLYNDSEYWAYNVLAGDIYAEFLPKSKVWLINRIPLKLMCDVPRAEDFLRSNSSLQLRNISPGEKIGLTIKILSKNSVPVKDYKQLITELRKIQLKVSILCENASGFRHSTRFWLDLQHSGFVNLFGRKYPTFTPWKNKDFRQNPQVKSGSKGLEIESGS